MELTVLYHSVYFMSVFIVKYCHNIIYTENNEIVKYIPKQRATINSSLWNIAIFSLVYCSFVR